MELQLGQMFIGFSLGVILTVIAVTYYGGIVAEKEEAEALDRGQELQDDLMGMMDEMEKDLKNRSK